jgi:plastocyanin
MRRVVLLAPLTAASLFAGCGGSGAESEPAPGSAPGGIEISATDFALAPPAVTVSEPGPVTVTVVNDGDVVHALALEGSGAATATDDLAPGASAELSAELQIGRYVLYCPIGDHRARGMEASLTVGKAPAQSQTGTEPTRSGGYGGYG